MVISCNMFCNINHRNGIESSVTKTTAFYPSGISTSQLMTSAKTIVKRSHCFMIENTKKQAYKKKYRSNLLSKNNNHLRIDNGLVQCFLWKFEMLHRSILFDKIYRIAQPAVPQTMLFNTQAAAVVHITSNLSALLSTSSESSFSSSYKMRIHTLINSKFKSEWSKNVSDRQVSEHKWKTKQLTPIRSKSLDFMSLGITELQIVE